MLYENTLSLAEILSVDANTLIGQRHEHAATIVRTTLGELGVDVLNLFSPFEHVFWSFGVFAAQDRVVRTLADSVRADALKRINAEQRRLGVSRKTVNAYEFLYPITAPQGDDYYPYQDNNNSVPYWWFAQRHVSCICPTDNLNNT